MQRSVSTSGFSVCSKLISVISVYVPKGDNPKSVLYYLKSYFSLFKPNTTLLCFKPYENRVSTSGVSGEGEVGTR